MAIAATAQWDVRTTGNDSSGGAFDGVSGTPGTDYSQQNSPQVVFTDLVIGATTTQLTSVANPFTSAYVGNIINITSGTGFTAGRYQVLSVTTGVATMDRAVGTAASTGGNGNLGGSLLTVAASTAAAALVTGSGSIPVIINIKAGTYTVTSSIAANQSSGQRFNLVGYQTTHGDNGTKPLITTATNSTDLIQITASFPITFTNLSFSNTAGTRAIGLASVGGTYPTIQVQNCIFNGFTYHIKGDNSGNTASYGDITNSVFLNATTGNIALWWDVEVYGCYFFGNAGVAINKTSNQANILSVKACVIAGGTKAIVIASAPTFIFIENNSLYGQSSDAISLGSTPNSFSNNIIYGAGGKGVNIGGSGNATPLSLYNNNAAGSNTGGNYDSTMYIGLNYVTLTASPYTNTSTGDFSLNAITGGGAACKGAGAPTFIGSSTTAAPNIGAVQSSGGGGGGGGGSFAFLG